MNENELISSSQSAARTSQDEAPISRHLSPEVIPDGFDDSPSDGATLTGPVAPEVSRNSPPGGCFSVRMYACKRMCVRVGLDSQARICIYVYIRKGVHVFTYIYVSMCLYTYMCTYDYIRICVHVSI